MQKKIITKSSTKSCLLEHLAHFSCERMFRYSSSKTKLINCSLSEGFVPDGFKKAIVTPVPDGFKKAIVTPLIKNSSFPHEMKNYHSVSGLCFISKLVERVVASQLIDHINSDGLDNKNQSAYMVGHSTERVLRSVKNEIHLSLSKGQALALTLLDQSALFDTIDHSTLLSCFQTWFGSGTILKWFQSYLIDCFNCIKICSTLSELRRLLYTDPQGSVIFGSKLHHEKLKSSLPVSRVSNPLHPVKVAKNLGVCFDY